MFPDSLRRLRKRAKLNQTELADALNVSQSTVAGWENGARKPDLDMIVRIAEYFGTTTDKLIDRDATVVSATVRSEITLDDEEKILIANYRKALPEYQAVAQQILGNPQNQQSREKASSSAG